MGVNSAYAYLQIKYYRNSQYPFTAEKWTSYSEVNSNFIHSIQFSGVPKNFTSSITKSKY